MAERVSAVVAHTAVAEAAVRADNVPAAGGAGSIREVSHCFALEGRPLPVLERISLGLDPGEFVAILGPSGCGKSSLLRLVAGLDVPMSGHIVMDGQPINGPDASRI